VIKILTENKAIGLLKKYNVREKKIEHCLNVAKIAKFLAEKLKEKGVRIDVETLYTAALLHDIGDKGRADEWDKDRHCELGVEILRKEGYTKAAGIVSRHNIRAFFSEQSSPKTWEEKVLNYADKRCKREIISMDEKEERHIKKFPEKEQEIKKAYSKAEKVEEEIFDILGIKAEDLGKFVRI